MVCVAHELRCECIVRDGSQKAPKYEVTLPASSSVHELITKVAANMKYEPHSFQLILQTRNTEPLILTEQTLGTLESAGLSSEAGYRNSFLLEVIQGREKNLVAKISVNDETNVPSPPPPELINIHMRSIRPPTASPATEYTFPSPVILHETGYVGLVNQAMTCYLNSLLQALYMTPEFRNALYKWQFDSSSHSSGPEKSIPFQLQKLFLNLQTSTKTAVETTELTRSFGWESGEVWQQHDIQELCRVMFDALEQEFKDTEQADLINQLYQGKMIDYVKCLECSTEKSREDTFLDIPLPVRPFGSTVAYGSIQEALRAFVQPETLEGNNQYLCDKCEKKCDAHKGLKFTKFPYLLTLHLKRFDFDYSTMHRIKLNDKLSFPDILDLNSFINSNNISEAENEAQNILSIKNDTSNADSTPDENLKNTAETQNNETDQDEDEGIDVNPGNNPENEKNRQQSISCGPFLYELYSIMIHSGSASGGHYYAYIKDFAKNEWYCFNDQTVTSLTHEDIKKTYGGTGGSARGYYSGAYSSSTNAYMLMYRQINKEINCYTMTEEEFPPHIKKLLLELKEAEEKEKAFRAKQEEMVRIKLYANHPILVQPRSCKMFCANDMTMEEVKAMAYSQLKLEDVVPEDQCRLVMYNKSTDEMEESLDSRDKDLVKDVFPNKFSSGHEVLMEIRDKNAQFLPYNLGDIKLTVYLYDIEQQAVESRSEVRTTPCQTLPDLKQLFQNYIHLKTDDIHIVLVKHSSLEYINDNSLPLNKQGFESCNKVFICYKGSEGDLSDKFQESDLYKHLDLIKNVITLQIHVPDTKKETLELLLIPPLIETSPGEEGKPQDSTPTGDGVPITNGLPEEELGYGSGAGGMSDQSASEDSSLTDSDRTIMGEVVNEGPLSSPSDSDQQLSSSDSQTIGKINGENKKWEREILEKPGLIQVIGENDAFDEDNSDTPPDVYFQATPYHAEDGQRMLRVVVDKAIQISALTKKLEKYLGVESKYMKLLKVAEGQEIFSTLRSCKDDERVLLKLERSLKSGEHRIAVNHFVPNASLPIQHLFDWIVSEGESIASLKKALLKEVEKRTPLRIPYERCRLRKQNFKSPGPVLLDSDVWDEVYRSNQQDVYLQEIESPDPITQSTYTLFFARRWHPTTDSFGHFEEFFVENKPPVTVSKKISDMSGIPAENVKFAKGKLAFPGETVAQVNDLNWKSDHESSQTVTNAINEWKKEDGAIIFYRDDREEIKSVSKEEQQTDSTQEASNSNSTFSYISGYSPRKERALKIYLDTPPRRTRSVVDVD